MTDPCNGGMMFHSIMTIIIAILPNTLMKIVMFFQMMDFNFHVIIILNACHLRLITKHNSLFTTI